MLEMQFVSSKHKDSAKLQLKICVDQGNAQSNLEDMITYCKPADNGL